MTDIETALSAHLRQRANEATPWPQLDAITDSDGTLRFEPEDTDLKQIDPRRRLLTIAAVLIVALVGAMAIVVPRNDASRNPAQSDAPIESEFDGTTTMAQIDSGANTALWDEGIPTFDVTLDSSGQFDRGHADGVEVGMPVVNGAGLIGKVSKVTENSSVVLVVADPRFLTAVDLPSQAISLVASGNGAGQMALIGDITLTTDDLGEIVYTSGGDSTLPRGIPIGTITSVGVPAGGRSGAIATITPFATAPVGSNSLANVILYKPD